MKGSGGNQAIQHFALIRFQIYNMLLGQLCLLQQ